MTWNATPDSSNMTGFGYEPKTKVLTVEFKSGERYEYEDVSEKTFQEMRDSESKGKFHSASIKGKFKHKKLPRPEGEHHARA